MHETKTTGDKQWKEIPTSEHVHEHDDIPAKPSATRRGPMAHTGHEHNQLSEKKRSALEIFLLLHSSTRPVASEPTIRVPHSAARQSTNRERLGGIAYLMKKTGRVRYSAVRASHQRGVSSPHNFCISPRIFSGTFSLSDAIFGKEYITKKYPTVNPTVRIRDS